MNMQQCEPQKINILMVDDNASNLLALESILQAPDRNLVKASSGDDALRYLLECDVAVILLDVNMPGISGLETAALIRGRERSRDIPIIFLTADSTGDRHISTGYALGAVDYILKPVEPEVLKSKVAVFVELFKKTEEVKHQAELLREKNIELENANLQRLSRLVELGQQLAAERDPVRLLEKFCHEARDIIGARYAAVGMLDDDGHTLCHFLTSGLETETAIEAGIPKIGQELLGTLLAERRPLRLCYTGDGASPSIKSSSSDQQPLQSFLGAPIISPARVYGWLYLADKFDAKEFSEADERLAVTLTSQVAVTYENARLYAETQRHAAALEQEVTERKQAEEERARLLVREQEARAEAEAANRAKDEFLATLSHELRTPLTSILGWTRLLRSGNLPEESSGGALETIERNARAQSQLIDDLLDVSRIITGKLRLDVRPLELASIIESVINSVRPAASAKGIEILMNLDNSAGPVMGDPNRLQQVVWNLLSNAVKFTPNHGRVYVGLTRRRSHVEITVSDTGQGIRADFLPHIFDRFRQADGTTTRVHGGLGLGLAIVRHLLELHGATIHAHSDGTGQGATFTVKLPAAVVHEADDIEQMHITSENVNFLSSDNSSVLKGLRVLVVDDEPDTRDLLDTVLRGHGADVKVAGSTSEALEILETWAASVLVSDIGMPGEDGYALIKKVRALDAKQKRRIPAIALTAYAGVEDRQRALAADFQVHMAKPLDPDELVHAVAHLAGCDVKV
jgi:signal transduction histidine kinase/response regulator RpfG family c-di-GMP phosphodiesterase